MRAAAIASAGVYLFLSLRRWENGWIDVCLFLTAFAGLFLILYRTASRGDLSLRWIVATAVLFRVLLLPAGHHDGGWDRFLLYDSDIWRYLWDGHVAAHWLNPYVHAPRAASLDALAASDAWSAIRDNINYDDIPTIYPPAAQLLFALVNATANRGSVLAMKVAVTLLDLLALAFLILTLQRLKRPATECIWYAWNPLVIKSFAGSGHIDSLTVAALAAMFYALSRTEWRDGSPVRSRSAAGAAFAVAILSKWGPIVLLPLLWRRLGVAGRVAACVPVLVSLWFIPNLFAGAAAFAEFWEFNALPYRVVAAITGSPRTARAICGAAIGLAALWIFRRSRQLEGGLELIARLSTYTLGALIVFSPAVMPWYVTWLLPSAILARERSWIAFSGFVLAAMFVVADGRERWYIVAGEYVALGWMLWRSSRKHVAQMDDPGDA